MKYGFFRVACSSPQIVVADCKKNCEKILQAIDEAVNQKTSLILFPELSITGCTCGDLFRQTTLLENSIFYLEFLAKATTSLEIISIVGLPISIDNNIYDCAAVLYKGEVLALIPRTFFPKNEETNLWRYFTPFCGRTENIFVSKSFPQVPFGTDIIINAGINSNFRLAIETGLDSRAIISPEQRHALYGATIIVNPSATNQIIGRTQIRRSLAISQSAKLACAYIIAEAGKGESTTDMVFGGHKLIAENGRIVAESTPFAEDSIYYDIDTQLLTQARIHSGLFINELSSSQNIENYKIINTDLCATKNLDLKYRIINPNPFVPIVQSELEERCKEVIELQAQGLAKRLQHTGIKKAILGLSGGLDSTLALLVTTEAFKICGIDSKEIVAVTMPCFGTSNRTYNNAVKLAKQLSTSFKEIPIQDSVRQHFKDIGQDEFNHDVTYENSQARERTQVLMDIANQIGALVIGTGDLSELALGWATYNGDHMSMYGVNASVPKTLVRHLVEWFKNRAYNQKQVELSSVLQDILETPVSPELLPPNKEGISQITEDIVGPYQLHDFFLYYVVRHGFSPKKIYHLAKCAFCQDGSNKLYQEETILKWLKVFYKRFFNQQFKRSCMPDGTKIGSVALSPRGSWSMPSDASAALWLNELETLN